MAYIRAGISGGKPSPELLWTNPNPTTGFSSLEVPLDLSDYDTLIVVYQWDTTQYTNVASHAFYPIPYTMTSFTKQGSYPDYIGASMPNNSAYLYGMARLITITDNGVTFGAAKSHDTNNDNRRVIPQAIYGLKATVYPS